MKDFSGLAHRVKINHGVEAGSLNLVSKSLDEWNVYLGMPIKKVKSRSKKLIYLKKKFLANENKVSKKNK